MQESKKTNKSPLIWVILGLVIVVLGVGGYYLIYKGSTNTNTVANTNNTSNGNVNNVVVNEMGGTKQYIDSAIGLKFTFPKELQLRNNYNDQLVATESASTIESIKLFQLSGDFLAAQDSIKKYVDGFTIEFAGTFEQIENATEQSFGANSGVGKSYIFHGSIDETGDYSMKATLFLIQSKNNENQYTLFVITGKNSSDFDVAVRGVLGSIEF